MITSKAVELKTHGKSNHDFFFPSFLCGEGSVFDQKELTCKVPADAVPCQESSSYYYTNEQFGRPEEKL